MALTKLRPAGQGFVNGSRNLVINGAMTVDQRNQTTTATGYTVDRFNIAKSNFDELVIAITQDTDNPSGNGFAHSLKLAITTAESAIAADELLYFDTRFEGQNIQHLCYGTSSAKSLTLSFWVKSPLAGKHSVTFYQSTPARSNLQSYTISSANTWEYKTITIDGDTSGNIANDNSPEIYLFWPLAGGSDFHGTPHTGWGAYTATDDFMFSDQVNLAGQTGNFFLTGVQLEIGENASDFEHENYGTTLAKCQRYYFRMGGSSAYARYTLGQCDSANNCNGVVELPVQMRDTPTIETTGTASNYAVYEAGIVHTCSSVPLVNALGSDKNVANLISVSTGNFAAGNAGELISNNSASAYIAFKSEL